ncbi:hypothetical protein N0M98_33550 [Paenibacillus doosanensis]|uniref:hypothetical protein n=1 Tax=Paenibacillus doosanensis TaxID=1229154 RepID=UPI00217F5C48|nr:hypothetical protein [Paenibacillus doosanensis]MCS7465011.1 hypothetical protein [Paenibacillus doosanensis]
MKSLKSVILCSAVSVLLASNALAAQTDPNVNGKAKVITSVENKRIFEVKNTTSNEDRTAKELKFKDMKSLKQSLKDFDLSDDDITSLGDRAADVAQLAYVKSLTKDQVKHLKTSIQGHKDAKVVELPVENGRVIDGEGSHPVSSAYYKMNPKVSNTQDTTKLDKSTVKTLANRTDYLGEGTGLHYVVNSTFNSWNKASMFIQFPWAYATTDFFFHYDNNTAQWEENDSPYLMFGKYTSSAGTDIGLVYSRHRGGWFLFNGGNPYNQPYKWLNPDDTSVPIPTGSDVSLVVTELENALRADLYYHNPSNGAWELHPQSTTFNWNTVGYNMGYHSWGAGQFTREHSLAQTAVDYKSGAYMLGAHEYNVYLYSDSRNVNTKWDGDVSTKHQWDGPADHDRNYVYPIEGTNYSIYTSYPYYDDQTNIDYR